MGRVSIRRLVLNNFRSFRGRHVIDFPDHGVVIVRGKNLNTRGDSGAGKTNVLIAIAYAFGFCPYAAKDLQCWDTEDPMSVEVHMDTDEGQAVLGRGDKLWIKVGDEKKISGSAKAVEARLDQLCGVSDKLREIVTYRDQVEPKRFLSMKDSEMKDFLVRVLKLDVLEKEIKTRSDWIVVYKRAVESAESAWKTIESEVEQRRSEVLPFEPQDEYGLIMEREVAEAKLDQDLKTLEGVRASLDIELERVEAVADAELKESTEKLEALGVETPESSRLKALLQQCDLHLGKVRAEDEENRRGYEDFTEKMRVKARALHNELAKIPGLIDDVARLTNEEASLSKSVCDRCGRSWEAAKEEAARHRQQIREKQDLLVDIRRHQPKAAELDRLIGERRFESNHLLPKLQEARAKIVQQLAVEEERVRSLKTHLATEIRLKKLSATSELVKKLKSKEAALLEAVAASREDVLTKSNRLALVRQSNQQGAEVAAAAKKRLEAAEERLATSKKTLDEVTLKHDTEADYLDMLRGFRNKIFDEVLAEIGIEASDIIGSLPNAAHVTIEFQSERETATGTRSEIKPIVFLRGVPRPLRSSVSGGQLTSISLAVDLAVIRVISRRLGCSLNWIVLDESFNGHDPVTKTSCLEVLSEYGKDKLVIVVDHASEFKEMVAQTIAVVYEDGQSRIE